MLKIDRSSAKEELILEDDGLEYTKAQISNYVNKIDIGRSRSGSLKSVSAFGIFGKLHFLNLKFLS